MKQLRYLKSAYETSQSLSIRIWPSNTIYSFQKLGPQKKRVSDGGFLFAQLVGFRILSSFWRVSLI